MAAPFAAGWAKVGIDRETARSAVCILLFLAVALYLFPGFSPVIFAGVALVALLRRQRLLAVAWLNVLIGMSGLLVVPNCEMAFVSLSIPAQPGPGGPRALLYALVYLAVLAFFYGYAHLSRWLPRALAPVLLPLLCVGTTLLHVPGHPWLGLAFALGWQGVWYNAFYVRALRRDSSISLPEFLACQRPFFAESVLPVPPLLSHYLARENTAAETARTQKSALGLLVILGLCTTCLMIFSRLAGESRVLQAIMNDWTGQDELLPARLAGISLASRWLITLGLFGRFLLANAIYLGRTVAMCRLMGLAVTNQVDWPFSSRSLFEFFRRTNHYYCQVLLDIFITPAFRLLEFVRNQRARFALAFIPGIFIGGLFIHYLLTFYWGPMVPGLNSTQAARALLQSFTPATAYWLALAVCTWLSLNFEAGRRRPGRGSVARAPRIAGYFVLSAVLQILMRHFEVGQVSLGERLSFIGSLFRR